MRFRTDYHYRKRKRVAKLVSVIDVKNGRFNAAEMTNVEAHQTALMELFGIYYNRFQGEKCKLMVAPYDITLRRNAENINVVQPDLMVICNLEENLNKEGYYLGTPALIVEILSESTLKKDLYKKLDLYMSCGVSEYWIVNPLKKDVIIYRFKDQDIEDYRMFKQSEIARSFVFEDLTVDLDKVFS